MIIYTKHSFYSSKLEDFTVLGLIDKMTDDKLTTE